MSGSRFKSWMGYSDKAVESPQCKSCEELEKRLNNARVALVLADNYAERLTRAREVFVQKLGDQIKGPLHGVVGICGAMREENALPPDARIQIGVITEMCGQILTTINELLQLDTAESGRMCMENVSFDPRRMTDLVFKLLSKKMIQKRVGRSIDIHKDVPKSLAGDVSRLRQCLVEIQDTLLEESRPGDVLELNMRVLDPEEQLIATMPRSKRFIPCLYELKLRRVPQRELANMEQVDIEREKEPQIVLSAELAQGLNGRLLRTQNYAAFHLVVHFRHPIGGANPSVRYSASRDPVTADKKYTILLYDENPVFLKLVCKSLASKGHVVDIMRDIEEVIGLVEAGTVHETYDCVLVDARRRSVAGSVASGAP
ncbi:two-component system NarL family sensor histidine kinase BarA [Klebsormidium nitens]|uniref:Two-component system NarL family sensor histidine kinase BarA n=1 Tax=Klebsormidium nitens TaxID=105231 RepID=A0A1Y1IMB3_KLENI|nr:two-component system NarL family sensor histidine kinase BarA [Klebsormidium nitens]|eukprot:GAQ89737.1 two-component system NarL family sensor histidine kinase BarA [Klebsormidium nitens]